MIEIKIKGVTWFVIKKLEHSERYLLTPLHSLHGTFKIMSKCDLTKELK